TMPRACSQCGCTEIDTDPARGDAVCTNCGTVLEDQIIVSEVQYQENAAGGASVIGQFVSNDGDGQIIIFVCRSKFYCGKNSYMNFLCAGFKRLKEMGGRLRMHQSSIETAFGFFKMAVAHRFTRGRKMEYVLASCLYLVCRVDPGGTPATIKYMVLLYHNFSWLCMPDPTSAICFFFFLPDPIIYIRRFANQLHFGDKINKVVESATRLVARMKRDWMHTGRRPAGLCGAALLLSARMHNFNRTIDHIIKVVKVCEGTIRTRLLEFESTPSAQLTIEEFDNVDLEEEQDPPCFTEGKRKAKLAQVKEGEFSDSVVKELSKFEQNINKSLKRKPITTDCASSEKVADADQALKLLEGDVLEQAAGEDWRSGEWEGLGGPNAKLGLAEENEDSQEASDVCLTKKENVDDVESKGKLDDGELDLTGIDDAEIDKLILSAEEVQHKAKWFEIEFGDFMEIVKEREEKRKIKEEAAAKKKGRGQPQKAKKHRGGYNMEAELAECMEILRKDMAEKKFSDKIDYNVLKSLEASGPAKLEGVASVAVVEGEAVRTVVVEDAAVEREEEAKHALMSRFRKSSVSERTADGRKNTPGKRVRIQPNATEETSKKSKLADVVVVEDHAPVTVIEEATPAAYTQPAAVDDIVDEDDDYEEEEDEEVADDILSARRLLGQDASAYDEEEDFFYEDH
ncbi:hypothetical protein EGW08_008611, partial [Elysia chlorotica]